MIYARIDSGLVVEIVEPMLDEEGKEIPVVERFHPEIVAALVDITSVQPRPQQGWTYDGSGFAAYTPPPRAPEEVLATNTGVRDVLLAEATARIAPLQDAVDLDEATDAEAALLKLWKQYRVAVNRVDLTQASPVWPTAPAA
jgi:hypothetical protein